MKDYDYEKITEKECIYNGFKHYKYKEFDIYMNKGEGYFKDNGIVFYKGKKIFCEHNYADYDWQNEKTLLKRIKEGDIICSGLWEEEELYEFKDYIEYKKKHNFILNHLGKILGGVCYLLEYPKEYKYKSLYGLDIFKDKESLSRYNNICKKFNSVFNKKFKYDEKFKIDAYKYELGNHEYQINWQGNWDVLSCFFNVKYAEDDYIENYKEQIGEKEFDIYKKSIKEYLKELREWEEEQEKTIKEVYA